MVKLGVRKTNSGDNYFVSIPKTIIEVLKWGKGDKLLVTKVEEKVVIEFVEKAKPDK